MMALKAYFALPAFIVRTSYTSLRPSWISVRTFHLSLSPSKIKCRCALLEYWCAVLIGQLFSIKLRTSEISTAHSRSTTLRTYCALIKYLPHFSGYSNYSKTRDKFCRYYIRVEQTRDFYINREFWYKLVRELSLSTIFIFLGHWGRHCLNIRHFGWFIFSVIFPFVRFSVKRFLCMAEHLRWSFCKDG